MNDEPLDLEIELDDKYLIDKCLFGDTWSKDRSDACKILAMQCNDEIKVIDTPEERERIRRNIINEAKFELSKSNDDIVNVMGGDRFNVWHRSNTIFDEGFDSKNFIDLLKQKKHGKCSIALYGVESQFWNQINEGLFQNIDNGKAIEDIEKLIFSDHSQYATTPKGVRDLQLRNWYHTKTAIDIDMTLDNAFKDYKKTINPDSLLDKEKDILYNYLVKEGKIKPETNYVLDISGQLKKYRICNDVHNPYINKGTFKYCSSALTSGEGQMLEIWRKKEGDKKALYTLTEFETGIREYVPRSPTIAFLVNSIRNNKRLSEEHLKMAKKYNIDSVDYAFYMARAQEELSSVKRYQNEVNRLKVRLSKNNWEMTDSLGCWHNFLDMMDKQDYPDYIKGRQKEVEMAYAIGDITEEQATQLLRDIGKLEEEFVESVKKLDKPIIYQPTRLRIYGSQLALQNLINDAMVRVPFEQVQVDNVTINNMRRGFMGVNLQQLIEHRIYSEEEIKELLEELDSLDIYQILEKMAETKAAIQRSGETLLDYIAEDISYMADRIFSKEEREALELIFGDISDFINDDDFAHYDYTSYDEDLNVKAIKEEGKNPIIFYDEDREDEIEIEPEENNGWDDMASEAFPSADLNIIQMKLLKESDKQLLLTTTVRMYGWFDLNKMKEAADNAINEQLDLLSDSLIDLTTTYVAQSEPKISVDYAFDEILKENYRELSTYADNIVKMMDYINKQVGWNEPNIYPKTTDDAYMENFLKDNAEDLKMQVRDNLI